LLLYSLCDATKNNNQKMHDVWWVTRLGFYVLITTLYDVVLACLGKMFSGGNGMARSVAEIIMATVKAGNGKARILLRFVHFWVWSGETDAYYLSVLVPWGKQSGCVLEIGTREGTDHLLYLWNSLSPAISLQ
jgi:hypothetical protein